MPRPIEKLKAQYGKLTVISEKNGSVLTRCTCGTEKVVSRSNLRSGQTKSCGKAGCREYTHEPGTGKKRGPKVRGPAWLQPQHIAKLWAAYHAGAEGQYLASQHGVTPQAVYSLIKRIRQEGGIIGYMTRLNAALEERGFRPFPVPEVDPAIVAEPEPTAVAVSLPIEKPAPIAYTAPATAPSPLGIPKPPPAYIPPAKRS